jgi:hypothetical protein
MTIKHDSIMWAKMAAEARLRAPEDPCQEDVLEVAKLCDYISASMERICHIIAENGGCTCGMCTPEVSGTLQ